MRCSCCNCNLSDYESVLRHPDTLEFLDICLACLEDIPLVPVAPTNVPPSHGWDDEQEFEVDYGEDTELE